MDRPGLLLGRATIADSHPNADLCGHSHGYPIVNADANNHGHPKFDGHTDDDPIAHLDADFHTYGHGHSDTQPAAQIHGHPDGHGDFDANLDTGSVIKKESYERQA